MAGLFGSYTLFSPVKGQVLIDGKPCSGAKLVQKVRSPYGEDQEVQFTTDAQGNFSFEPMTEKKGFFSWLPSEFVASQRILITYQGKEYTGWSHSKRSGDLNSETKTREELHSGGKGKPFELVCELNKVTEEVDKYNGICRFKQSL